MKPILTAVLICLRDGTGWAGSLQLDNAAEQSGLVRGRDALAHATLAIVGIPATWQVEELRRHRIGQHRVV